MTNDNDNSTGRCAWPWEPVGKWIFQVQFIGWWTAWVRTCTNHHSCNTFMENPGISMTSQTKGSLWQGHMQMQGTRCGLNQSSYPFEMGRRCWSKMMEVTGILSNNYFSRTWLCCAKEPAQEHLPLWLGSWTERTDFPVVFSCQFGSDQPEHSHAF